MASAAVRTLLVCRASCIARASGASIFQRSNRSLARRCYIGGGVEYGSQWNLMGVIGREFSKGTRVRGDRGPVPIVAASKRGGGGGGGGGAAAAAMVKEEVEDESDDEDQDEDDSGKEKISRNASKKQSARARIWGRELASLSPAQLRQACKWASLDDDVYDAVMLVKNLGTSQKVKHGRRRQYNYIGGLLRDVDPEIMGPVLKATKDGDVEGLVFIPSNQSDDVDDEFEDETEDEQAQVEDDGALLEVESWLEGLVGGDRAVEEEVYSIYDVDFDRQELRKLVRDARKHEIKATATSDAGEAEVEQELSEAEISVLRSKLETAQKSLLQFLMKIVKERRDSGYDSAVQ